MTKNALILISIIISSAVLTGCANYLGPDDHGRICDPGVMLVDSLGCLPGCDLDANAYFCTADGRGAECRIRSGHVCRVDPGCPGGGADCTAGISACLRHGTTSCPAGSSVAEICNAVAGSPVAEICGDGIDNDCDGVVDDGCSTCVPSGAEICDNLDNNCNGQIDEGCDDDNDDYCDATMNMGTSGSLACPFTPPGRTVGDDCNDNNVRIHPGGSETCNMVDDNCNGIVDESPGSTVAGSVCPVTCAVTNSGIELCDGIDNDCDGYTDEGGVCVVCEDNLGGTLRVRPSASLLASCSRGLVTIAWGPGGTELRSIAHATSYSIVMNSSWRGWVRLQAFCPDDASRGSEIGYWAGSVTDWNPRIGGTLRSAGFTVDIDGRDLSDAGYVCRESSSSSLSKPHVPLDECSTFACPR